jgi:hypothetical protein
VRHLPEWFPGASFKTKGRLWKDTLHTLVEVPYNWAKQRIQHGDTNESFVTGLVQEKGSNLHLSEYDEYIARWSAASIYTGNADTVSIVHLEESYLRFANDVTIRRSLLLRASFWS